MADSVRIPDNQRSEMQLEIRRELQLDGVIPMGD